MSFHHDGDTVAGSPLQHRLKRKIARAYRSGDIARVYDLCRKYLDQAPDDTQVLPLAGLSAAQLGLKSEARELFAAQKSALDRAGGSARAYFAVCLALEEMGQTEQAFDALQSALQLDQDNQDLQVKKASLLEQRGALEEATSLCNELLAKAPEQPHVLSTLGVIQQKQGDHARAIDTYLTALRLAPEMVHIHNNLSMAFMHAKQAGRLVDFCRDWLERSPGNVEALSFLGLALNETGAGDQAHDVFDFDRFVRTYDIDPPDGFASIAAFNDALEAHVIAHPTLAVPPEDDPTYHHASLSITEELLAGRKGPMGQLEEAMEKNVRQYLKDIAEGPDHPFLARPPSSWDLSSWAAVLERQGNLEPHIHLDGYVSGVYYARIPDEVRQAEDPGDGEVAGSIEMGRPPHELGCGTKPVVRMLKPEEGMMLLFPAYFYHRTVPFEATKRRISIAFDVVPRS